MRDEGNGPVVHRAIRLLESEPRAQGAASRQSESSDSCAARSGTTSGVQAGRPLECLYGIKSRGRTQMALGRLSGNGDGRLRRAVRSLAVKIVIAIAIIPGIFAALPAYAEAALSATLTVAPAHVLP